MLEAIAPEPMDRVLEIGTGSGYAAAVLAEMVAEVYTVERLGTLATTARARLADLHYPSVHVLEGDGTLGWPEHAPYDGIVVTAGGPDVPGPLLLQLRVGGHLVVPVGPTSRSQELVRVTRRASDDGALARAIRQLGGDAHGGRLHLVRTPLLGALPPLTNAPRRPT